MKKHKRRIKLIRPAMQLRLVAGFLGLAAVGMCLQLVLLQHMVMSAAKAVPGGGGELADVMPDLMMRAWFYSFVGLSPVLLAFGVLFTFRVAGPISRFESYLTSIAAGEDVDSCKIREDDELHGLCDLLNRAIATVRRESSPDLSKSVDGDSDEAREDQVAARRETAHGSVENESRHETGDDVRDEDEEVADAEVRGEAPEESTDETGTRDDGDDDRDEASRLAS